MDKEEMTQIINRIYLCYPNFAYAKDPIEVAKTWYELLKECDYHQVNEKLTDWIRYNDRPPAIANLMVEDWRKGYEIV